MITELCTCDLSSIPLPVPEEMAKNIITHVIKGVQVLHKNKIMHRDLKPENLLIH